MNNKNNSQIIQISILISILLFLIIISVFFGGIRIQNSMLFATIFVLFDLIILINLFTIYIIKRKKLVLLIITLFLLFVFFSLGKALYKENKIKKVHIGMHKSEVEELFGKGKPDISEPSCGKCTQNYTQYYYNLGPIFGIHILKIVILFVILMM